MSIDELATHIALLLVGVVLVVIGFALTFNVPWLPIFFGGTFMVRSYLALRRLG